MPSSALIGDYVLDVLNIFVRVVIFCLGLFFVASAIRSAVRILVLPRSAQDKIGRTVFRSMRLLFNLRASKVTTYEERDSIMALYAPVSLLLLPVVWLAIVLLGYQLIYWSLGVRGWIQAFRVSGSSLLTLGFATVDQLAISALAFSEAAIGLIVVALLIAYLPTMYSAFQRREAAVTMLEVRAGSPPSAVEMIERFNRLGRMDKLSETWARWEEWFVDIEETHTSLAALAFFRSPQGHRSWVTAAGAVLDAAALCQSTLDLPPDPQASLCIRAGYLALRYIGSFFEIEYNDQPQPTDPISIARFEFDAVYDRLAQVGLPLKPDRDDAWKNFRGWRINYDTVLLALAALTMAPEAPWSSDRSLRLLPNRQKQWRTSPSPGIPRHSFTSGHNSSKLTEQERFRSVDESRGSNRGNPKA
jgi:hypothetical protein